MSRSGTSAPRRLRGADRRMVIVLGLPTFALAFATTSVSTYLPVLLHASTHSTVVIGVIVGAEGVMALWVPVLVGGWSDRAREHGISRLRFVLAATPLVMASLVLMGLVSSLPALGAIVAFYFAAYFVAYEPYRALYPDLLDDEIAGRAQSAQALWRGGGTLLALVAGGALIALFAALPFVLAAGLVAVAIVALAVLLPRVHPNPRGALLRSRRRRGGARASLPEALRAARSTMSDAWQLVSDDVSLRLFAVANCLWEMALGALKTFVILYVTVGLGFSLGSASLIVGAGSAVILVGVVASGRAADRVGPLAVMSVGLLLYGLAMAALIFTTNHVVLLLCVPLVALGGGLVMTLPYAVLMPLMPDGAHGLLTGFYSFSRGLGVMLGPLLGGLAIELLGGSFSATHGYATVWIVTSACILASVPVTLALWARCRGRSLLPLLSHLSRRLARSPR